MQNWRFLLPTNFSKSSNSTVFKYLVEYKKSLGRTDHRNRGVLAPNQSSVGAFVILVQNNCALRHNSAPEAQ
jgi:hypothetical protein